MCADTLRTVRKRSNTFSIRPRLKRMPDRCIHSGVRADPFRSRRAPIRSDQAHRSGQACSDWSRCHGRGERDAALGIRNTDNKIVIMVQVTECGQPLAVGCLMLIHKHEWFGPVAFVQPILATSRDPCSFTASCLDGSYREASHRVNLCSHEK
jgi:hypothetical protein